MDADSIFVYEPVCLLPAGDAGVGQPFQSDDDHGGGETVAAAGSNRASRTGR